MLDLEGCAGNSNDKLASKQEFIENLDLNINKSILDFGFDDYIITPDDTIASDDTITPDFATKLPTSELVDTDSFPKLISCAIKKRPISKYPNFSIISCGGEGDTSRVLQVFSELITSESWTTYFKNFHNPHFFHGLQDYKIWLQKSGFEIKRLEFVQKDITHVEKKGLLSRICNAWMPLKKRLLKDQADNFITQFVNLYLENNSVDSQKSTSASVVRLEVDAHKHKTEQTILPSTYQ